MDKYFFIEFTLALFISLSSLYLIRVNNKLKHKCNYLQDICKEKTKMLVDCKIDNNELSIKISELSSTVANQKEQIISLRRAERKHKSIIKNLSDKNGHKRTLSDLK